MRKIEVHENADKQNKLENQNEIKFKDENFSPNNSVPNFPNRVSLFSN